jgi:transposase
VLVVSPSDTGIRQARAKTDRLDARTLARLLAAGSLDGVWMPDRWTWVMRRRLSRRSQLVWARSRAKNQIHAVLMRQLVGRAPFADLFGVKGRESGSHSCSCRSRSQRRSAPLCARSSSSTRRSQRSSA